MMRWLERPVFMVQCNMILINTNKLFDDAVFGQIPYIKPIRKVRAFKENIYSEYPGMSQYRSFSRYFSSGIVPIDRSNTISTPFNMSLMSCLEMPNYEVTDISYDECCNSRAKQILNTGIPKH